MRLSALALLFAFAELRGQTGTPLPLSKLPATAAAYSQNSSYRLGQGDLVSIHVLDFDEIPDRPFAVDSAGNLELPLVGSVHAGGLTLAELPPIICERLRRYLLDPTVSVALAEARDLPITVLGAVNAPGVKQLHGRKTLLEALAEAGGSQANAGTEVTIVRAAAEGPIPLPGATSSTDGFFTASADLQTLLHAQNPRENITLRAHDVITVPQAETVYVLGEVAHPGGYAIKGGKALPVLDAVALAGGTNRTANITHAKVLRATANGAERTEYAVDLHRVLGGKDGEFQLTPSDILYIPTNKGKVVATRTLEALIGTGSSIAVFRGSR